MLSIKKIRYDFYEKPIIDILKSIEISKPYFYRNKSKNTANNFIWLHKNNKWYFVIEKECNILWCNYNRIWKTYYDNDMTYDEIKLHIKKTIEKEYNIICGLTPVCTYIESEMDYRDSIDKVYKKFLFEKNNSIIKIISITLHRIFYRK